MPLSCAVLLLSVEPSSGQLLRSEEIEQFLREGKILESRSVSIGITGTRLVTLSNCRLTHSPHVQVIDEGKNIHTTATGTELNFRDSYGFNVAAYGLDRLLGPKMTPPWVAWCWQGREAAFTWWLSDGMMERDRKQKKLEPRDVERLNKQMYVVPCL